MGPAPQQGLVFYLPLGKGQGLCQGTGKGWSQGIQLLGRDSDSTFPWGVQTVLILDLWLVGKSGLGTKDTVLAGRTYSWYNSGGLITSSRGSRDSRGKELLLTLSLHTLDLLNSKEKLATFWYLVLEQYGKWETHRSSIHFPHFLQKTTSCFDKNSASVCMGSIKSWTKPPQSSRLW